jgi:hypothetical protein
MRRLVATTPAKGFLAIRHVEKTWQSPDIGTVATTNRQKRRAQLSVHRGRHAVAGLTDPARMRPASRHAHIDSI